jgi:Putative prokaryotic signal transducing protein
MPDEKRRCVFVASGEAQAQQVLAFLRAWEIDATLRGESLRKIDGLKIGDLAAVEILVPAADEARARHLLESVEAGEFQLDEDHESQTE